MKSKKFLSIGKCIAVLLSLCMLAAVIPSTVLAGPVVNENILPAFSADQMVTVGSGAFEEPHFVELGENDDLIAVTGTISYQLSNGSTYDSSDALKAFLATQPIGAVISVDYMFLGSGDYIDFMDMGTLTFTMVSGVDNVNITIDEPQTGKQLANTADVNGSAAGEAVHSECLIVTDINWAKLGESAGESNNSVAAADTVYTASIVVKTDRGVSFNNNVNDIAVQVNGVDVAIQNKSLNIQENICELTVLYQFDKTEVAASDYKIIEGANGSWTQNSDGTLTIRANGDFSKFTGVKVDDVLIDAKNYTAVSGSTIITLKSDYLKTLSIGTHKLTVLYIDGECSTNFEVNKAASEQTESLDTMKPANSKSPQTGNNSSPALLFALLFASGAGLLGTTVYSKRKKRAE